MSKKAMSSKIVSVKEVGEKVLQEKEEQSQKVEQIELSAKNLFGKAKKQLPLVAKEEKEWPERLVVRFEKVSLKFTKEFFALFEISFDAFEGEHIAILGENECGKTSILRILSALEQPCSGSVKVFNKPLSNKLFMKEVMLGFLPENPALFMRKSVLDNMVYAKRIREKKTKTDADVASGVLFDLGLIDLLHLPVHKLSYYQKQCVALARLKFRPMDIVLMDGVLDHMSEIESNQFMNILSKVISPKTLFIFSTHDSLLAKRFASRTIKLENGSLLE